MVVKRDMSGVLAVSGGRGAFGSSVEWRNIVVRDVKGIVYSVIIMRLLEVLFWHLRQMLYAFSR